MFIRFIQSCDHLSRDVVQNGFMSSIYIHMYYFFVFLAFFVDTITQTSPGFSFCEDLLLLLVIYESISFSFFDIVMMDCENNRVMGLGRQAVRTPQRRFASLDSFILSSHLLQAC